MCYVPKAQKNAERKPPTSPDILSAEKTLVLFTKGSNVRRPIAFEIFMGFLSNLFGKKETTTPFELEPTAEMMDEDRYWKLVAESLEQSGGDQECQANGLVGELEKLEPVESVGFRLRTDKLLYDTYNSKMWCAAYIMNGGCSDDGFEYFRLWVISRGREVYENAKANPDTLADFDEDELMGQGYDFESFWYVSNDAFKNKTGKDLYEFISDDFQFGEGNYPAMDFDWEEENPDSMKALCPRLAEKFEDRY